MILQIAYKNTLHKPLTALLSVILVAFGVGLIALLNMVVGQITEKFERNIQGVDMVVGAKGSPLQLVLSALFQADAPTGNIPMAAAQRIARHRMVRQALPLAYGDSYYGYKIVGCDTQYLVHFGAKMAQGSTFKNDFEVCVGSKAAQQLKLKIGAKFYGAHGNQTTTETHHTAHAYTVVGILQPTRTIADQLILCSIPSVWRTHDENHDKNHNENHQESHHENEPDTADVQITALLIKFKTPMALMQLPRYINAQPQLQAALPSIEINRLITLIGVGADALNALAALIMAVSGMSIFVALYTNLKSRQNELALLRLMGAKPVQLFVLIITEALVLTFAGFLVGIVACRGILYGVAHYISADFNDNFEAFVPIQPHEIYLFAACILLGFIAAILPAVVAYRTSVAHNLSQSSNF